MVIDNDKGEDALAVDFKGTFKIELPELIREGALEGLRSWWGWRWLGDTVVAEQNVGDGAFGGQRVWEWMCDVVSVNFLRTPAEAIAEKQDGTFDEG